MNWKVFDFFGRFFWILIGDGYRIYIQKGFVKNPKDHLLLEKKNHKEASKKKISPLFSLGHFLILFAHPRQQS